MISLGKKMFKLFLGEQSCAQRGVEVALRNNHVLGIAKA
jgi:hypothetical protein